MSSPKDKVWARIHRQRTRNAAANVNSPYRIFYIFLTDMDNARASTEDFTSWSNSISQAALKLDRSMQHIDPEVFIELEWADLEDWSKASVDSINIHWSSIYRRNHPLSDAQKNISIADLLIRGFFEEE